jgi:hypothetical protein
VVDWWCGCLVVWWCGGLVVWLFVLWNPSRVGTAM